MEGSSQVMATLHGGSWENKLLSPLSLAPWAELSQKPEGEVQTGQPSGAQKEQGTEGKRRTGRQLTLSPTAHLGMELSWD